MCNEAAGTSNDLEAWAVKSYPSSLIAAMALGLIVVAGREPALYTSTLSASPAAPAKSTLVLDKAHTHALAPLPLALAALGLDA